MQKWVIGGLVMLLIPWLMALVWMRGEAAQGSVIRDGTMQGGAIQGAAVHRGGDMDAQGADGGGEKAAGPAGAKDAESGAGVQAAAAGDDAAGAQNGAAAGEQDGAVTGAQNGAAAGEQDGAMPGGRDGAAEDAGSVERRKIRMERGGIETYMRLEDYLAGVMVCQMNPDYHMEALKCQAIVARTYLCRLMGTREEIWEEELDLDYLGTMAGVGLGERERLAQSLGRCEQAVAETSGVVMKYEDRYILPLFHGMSAGRTRKGEEDYPYLQPVDSGWDTEREDFIQNFEWSPEAFAAAVNQIPDAQPVTGSQVPSQIQTVKKDDSGYVLQMKIGAKTYSGEEIQYALGLPSSCFTLEGDENHIRAIVRGSGHGYGLSQAGADGMADEGWGYEDILHYYYKNISLMTE